MSTRPGMGPLDWVALGCLTALAVVAVRQLPRLWRRETSAWDTVPNWAPYPLAIGRGLVRAIPTAVVVAWALILGLLVGGLATSERPPFALIGSRAYAIVVLPLVAVAVVAMCLMLAVIFFNWPKFPVPPHLRAQPGAIEEWRRWWRRRRRRRDMRGPPANVRSR